MGTWRSGDVRRAARSQPLHRAVARAILQDPERALALAHQRLARVAQDPRARYYRDEWATWLRGPVSDIVHLLTDDDSEYADALRKMSPFVGLITQAERRAIYRAYAVETNAPLDL